MQMHIQTREWHMAGWAKHDRDLKRYTLYGQPHFSVGGRLAPDRCPHRGAKLSEGQLVDGCVRCPFHGRCFGPAKDKKLFRGVVKDGALWYGGKDPASIPRLPEFDDPSYRTVLMSRRLRGVSPFAFLESGIDFEHVTTVHRVAIQGLGRPDTQLDPVSNTKLHTFEAPDFRLQVETRFWLPFSNSLKFLLHDKKRDTTYEPFILFFSMTPHGPTDVTLHVRSMRKVVTNFPGVEALLDLFFVAVSDIPIYEDAAVVRGVALQGALSHDRLTGEDDLIELYRSKMLYLMPEVVQYCLQSA